MFCQLALKVLKNCEIAIQYLHREKLENFKPKQESVVPTVDLIAAVCGTELRRKGRADCCFISLLTSAVLIIIKFCIYHKNGKYTNFRRYSQITFIPCVLCACLSVHVYVCYIK